MEEADFSEDTTYEQQEDLPYDGDLSRIKTCNDFSFTSNNDTLDVPNPMISAVDDPPGATCRHTVTAMTLGEMSENAVNNTYDKEKQCGVTLHIFDNKGDTWKSNISDILRHHLSKEQFLRGQGIDCETLPEISKADSLDEASIIKDIILRYKNSWPKKQTPEVSDLLNPRRDDENSNKPSCSPILIKENTSHLEGPVTAGGSNHQEDPNFLAKIRASSNKQNSYQGQAPQKQQAEKVEPMAYVRHELLTGIESETSPLKLSSNSQKDPSSSSYIFQRISHGKQMCQKLKEQTDQLKTKVQEFSKRIKQDSTCHLQDRKLVLEELQGHLELLEQEFVANKEQHLTLQQQVHKLEFPTIGDFDPERKQKMEKKGYRKINCGQFSIVIQEKVPRPDWTPSSDTGNSFCSDSGAGLQHNRCEDCGVKMLCSRRICSNDPAKEFHYRYNTPGQNYLNHNERVAFVQSHSVDENKNSSPSCSKPKRICSQRVNSKSFQGEYEPMTGKKNLKAFRTYSSQLATSSPHSCRISGNKSLGDFNSIEETESKILNSALDQALKTATTLKETTDKMIKAIAEDLAKAQRWRNRLKRY